MGASSKYIDKDTLRELSARSDLWGAWLTLHVWGTIILAGAFFVKWPHPSTFLLSFLLIGSRQHGMAVLMHDAAHGVLFKTKALNKFVGHYILALPFGGNLSEYRRYHLKHHRYAQRPEDPDLPLSAKFPVTQMSLMRKFSRDIIGWTAARIRIAQFMQARKGAASGDNGPGSDVLSPVSFSPALIINVLIFAGLALCGLWWAYFALWLLPLFTWFQVVLRLRNISEHALTSHDDNPLTHARTTRTNLLTRIFFAPYWVNYHVEHHAYMYVPCYRLKALHKELLIRGYRDKMNIAPGYRAVLDLATRPAT